MARSQEHFRARTPPRNESWPSPPGWRARSGHPDERERRMRESDTPAAARIGAADGAPPLRPSLVATRRDPRIYLALPAPRWYFADALAWYSPSDKTLLGLSPASVDRIGAIGVTLALH